MSTDNYISKAIKNLTEELEKAKGDLFAEPILNFIIEKCAESEEMSKIICTRKKSWKSCSEYVTEKASDYLKGKLGAIKDDVVFGWASEYFLEDKDDEEKKEPVKKQEPVKQKAPVKKKEPVKKKSPAKKKAAVKKEEIDFTQMDIFDLIGG